MEVESEEIIHIETGPQSDVRFRPPHQLCLALPIRKEVYNLLVYQRLESFWAACASRRQICEKEITVGKYRTEEKMGEVRDWKTGKIGEYRVSLFYLSSASLATFEGR